MSCPVIICTNPDDLSIGAAGNALYAVNQISLLQNCPPGCYCPAGTFPRVFTYLTDQIPPVVPVGGSGSVFILRLMGCISEISRTLPAEASASELRAAATAIQSEWAGQQAICDARALTGVKCGTFFSNDRLTFGCPNGQTLSWVGAYSLTITKGPPGNGLTVHITNSTNADIQGAEYSFVNGVGAPPVGFGVVAPGAVSQLIMTVIIGAPGNAWSLQRNGVVIYSEPNFLNNTDIAQTLFQSQFPPYVAFDPTSNLLVMAAGQFYADTKAEANAIAGAKLAEIAAADIASGALACT
jgi:hypothetical protein